MAERADIAWFETLFARSPDPWGTRRRHDERFKRQAIVRLLPVGPLGRVLELGSGNGSNSRALADRALRLDACDGAPTAVDLTRAALADRPPGRARVHALALPGRFPADRYDAIVLAEILYYLDERTLRAVATQTARTLRPGGRLVMCHHHRQFHDATQRQATLHARFAAMAGTWRIAGRHRTGAWEVVALVRASRGPSDRPPRIR